LAAHEGLWHVAIASGNAWIIESCIQLFPSHDSVLPSLSGLIHAFQ